MTDQDTRTEQRQEGCVHIYTGNGKGKTTAALGLCLRAVGAGYRVYIGQFMKAGNYSELKALKRLGDRVTVEQFGTGRFVRGTPSEADRQKAREGFQTALAALTGGGYQMVILDECMIALHQGLLSLAQVQSLIALRPTVVELVLTGRHAPSEIIAQADLVTDMQEVKHYFRKGIKARTGIEK
jgi:cob(I)alamin adenosyltransferase